MFKISKVIIIFGLLLSGLLLASNVHAQTDEERLAQLRIQIEQLEKEAQQYRSNIKSEQIKADSLKKEINLLKNQILRLQAQISATSKKIDKTSIEIGGVENEISATQDKIDTQKDAIGRLLLVLNQRDNEPLLATVLKNKSLSDFFREGQYVANINSSLLDLVNDLRETKASFENNKNQLEGKKDELENLKQEQSAQKASLSNATATKNNILAQTKGQEAQYQKMLANVEKKKAAFFKEVRELELKVISGGLYIVRIKAENLPPKGTKLFQWPEDDPRITQGYGMTAYARRGAYGGAPHNGIDMAGGFGTPVKAIGEGQIVANGYNDGWGNWVAIKHAYNLVSVYGHMSSLSFLKVGTNVGTGEVIGYEGSTGNSTGSHLHLSIYKEFFTYIHDRKDQLYFNYFDGSLNPRDYL